MKTVYRVVVATPSEFAIVSQPLARPRLKCVYCGHNREQAELVYLENACGDDETRQATHIEAVTYDSFAVEGCDPPMVQRLSMIGPKVNKP